MVCGNERITWADLAQRAERAAAGLARHGIGRGDRVALLRDGRLVEEGSPPDVLRADVLQATYGDEVMLSQHPATGRPIVLPAVPGQEGDGDG